MTRKEKFAFVKRGDIVIICIVLVAAILVGAYALLATLSKTDGERLLVETPEGQKSFLLSEDSEFDIKSCGYTLTVRIEAGEARVLYCDCPDGICESMGAIGRSGESIVCVPARVKLYIDGGGEYDAVAG